MEKTALTVSQLNFFIKSLIESERRLKSVAVTGEISNFVDHYKTGHLYFSLKDGASSIKAVMFRSDAARLKFKPENGAEVIVYGRVAVYERDGVYQIYAERMEPVGAGALALAYEQLKKKLTAEGLFDAAKKRPLPKYPRNIGVITSRSGAAVRDIFNVLSRRWPVAKMTLYPVLVQGAGAAASVSEAIGLANRSGQDDLLIVARGGGSAEDLWAFNEEILVRAVAASGIPIVSGVGHETDFTLCDFAADLRAPTPSAAAELSVPDIFEERAAARRLRDRLDRAVNGRLDGMRRTVDRYGTAQVRNRIVSIIDGGMQYVDGLDGRMKNRVETRIASQQAALAGCVTSLDLLNPLKILTRGYSVCEKDGAAVKDISRLSPGDSVLLRLSGGEADCTVNETRKNNDE